VIFVRFARVRRGAVSDSRNDNSVGLTRSENNPVAFAPPRDGTSIDPHTAAATFIQEYARNTVWCGGGLALAQPLHHTRQHR
jgi:hypothetical protein